MAAGARRLPVMSRINVRRLYKPTSKCRVSSALRRQCVANGRGGIVVSSQCNAIGNVGIGAAAVWLAGQRGRGCDTAGGYKRMTASIQTWR